MSKVENIKGPTVLFLAYGTDTIKYQAILSIFTLFHHLGADDEELPVVIYTDSEGGVLKQYLGNLPVVIEVMSAAKIKEFCGPHDYHFRVKPLVMKDFAAKYQQNFMFVDTDTFFLRNPVELIKKISPGNTIMNAAEYNFIDGGVYEPQHWLEMRRALKGHEFVVQGKTITIPLSTMMWNSGVVGISHQDSALLDDIIDTTDDMYGKVKIFFVEQLAPSYILQNNTHLSSSEDYIEHYWPKEIKTSFNFKIRDFLKKNASKPGQELYKLAFEFAKEVVKTPTSEQYHEPIISRIRVRMKLVMKVVRRGYI